MDILCLNMKIERKILVPILIGIIVILAGIIFYIFVVKPAFNGYVTKLQSQGYAIAVYSLMQQASTCQPVPLYFGNVTLYVIAIGCLPKECLSSQQLEVNLS